MKTLHILTCCLVLSLQDGNTQNIYTRAAGDSVTVQHVFSSNRLWKFLCRGTCEGNLIGTSGDREQRGRYSIRYHRVQAGGSLSVTIRQLNTADTGRYRFGVGRLSRALYEEFDIIVVDAPSTLSPDMASKDSATVPSTFTPPPTAATTPSHNTSSTSISSVASSPSGLLLYVSLTLVVTVVLTSLAVLVAYIHGNKLRASRTRGNPDTDMEVALYENQLPFFEEHIYQDLNPATKDQNQIYATVTQKNREYVTL